eukprot:10384675-Lingulodinium_polyedra.AAC.1
MKCSVPARSTAACQDDGFLQRCHARSQSLGCGTAPCKSSSSSSRLCNLTRTGAVGATRRAAARLCSSDRRCL